MKPDRNIFSAAKERSDRKNGCGLSLRSLRSFAVPIVLFWGAHAEAADWVKAYRGGDYSNALQALETASTNFPDIGNYNRGNILYRQKNFQDSEKAYAEAAALTQEDSLKQKALYNRGTALLAGCTGDLKVAPEQQLDAKIDAATQATGLFEQALTLKPDDLDAKQNLERALKLKEELEKQKKEKQQKQQQNKQDQQNKDQNQKDQKQDQQQQNDQNNQQQQNQQDQQKQDEQQKQDQSGSENQKQQQDQQQNQQQEQPQPGQPKQAGEMSPEEAQQLLDAMKQDEQDQRANLKPFLGGPVRVEKDW